MYSEYTINGRTIPIIDTGNAMLVGLWDLAREMGWGNGLETLEPLVMCDHAGYFKVDYRGTVQSYPFVTGDDIFRLQANAPDQEKAKDVVDRLTEFEEKLRAEQSKAGEEMRAPAAPEAGKSPENDQEQSAKADAGKLRLSLVPVQIIRDIAEVREYGNRKYGDPENWRKVDMRRYVDALLRHMLAFVEDPDGVDSESGIQHYKHMACNMAFICEMMRGR